MSKITHNNIIMWLEDIVPQMQKSASAEDCLLKYAKEHNMPPAVLERMGHMFNSLKTNSAYNLAKTASDRGKFITTLDVPALVEKYSSFSKGTDFSKMITTISNLCPLEHGQSMIMRKSASAKSKVGDLNDLFMLKDQALMNPELHEKVAKALNVSEIKKEAASTKTKNETYEYINAGDRLISLAHNYAHKAMQVKSAAVKKIADKYLRSEFNGFAKSASDISRYLEEDKDFCEAIEKLTVDVCKVNKKFASYIDEDSKKFASIKNKKFKLLKESDISLEDANLFNDYYEGVKLANFADQLLDFGCELKKYAEAAPKFDWSSIDLEKPYSLNELNDLIQDMEYARARETQQRLKNKNIDPYVDKAEETAKHFIGLHLEEMRKNLEHQEEMKRKLEHAERMDAAMSAQEARAEKAEQERIREKAEAKLKAEEVARQAKEEKELAEKARNAKQLTDAFTGGVKNIGTGFKDMSKSLVDSTLKIMNEAADAKYNDPVALDPIQKAMRSVQAKSILEQLLYTDPVLSTLNDDEVDNVMEVYNTIVTRNPSIALDKGMLRSFLRQAANAKGIDAASVKTLKEI